MIPDTTTAQATSSSSGAACSARVNGVVVTVQLARDLTVAAGDVLLVHRVDQTYYGCCRLYASAAADPGAPDTPDPNTDPITGTTVIMPVYTGTYRDSAWSTATADTLQGVSGGFGNATGAAFYGSKPASLAGVTVAAASVRLRRGYGGPAAATAVTLNLVTETEQPAGAPTLTLSTAGPSLVPNQLSEAYPVPTAWAQALADGSAGGLAVYDADGSPFVRMAGRGSDPSAWLLSIDWSR